MIVLALPLLTALVADDAPKPADIVVRSTLKTSQGQMICALHDRASTFPTKPDQAVQTTQAPIADRRATCRFPNIPPGTYAVAIVHDENANGKLDANWLGLPREGYGASRDAEGRMGPPAFDDAAFKHQRTTTSMMLTMRYP